MYDNIRIILIGAGNVATHLGKELKKNGFRIVQVYSRSESSSSKLAESLKCESITDLNDLNKQADLYIISVHDSAINTIVRRIDIKNKLIVHTSGSIQMNVFEGVSANYGVFYPLQTFSKSKDLNFKSIPVCIEANSQENRNKLMELGRILSDDVRIITSDQRKIIHLAAVFACNFTNFMYYISDELLKQNDISFDIIKPLIKESTEKVMVKNPAHIQTGPAVRGDIETIHKHLEMLKRYPEYVEIYQLISEKIKTNLKKKLT